jgi:outer membrane autotransporter protein
VLQGRMARGGSSGEALLSEGELWLQPFGTWANQDERDGVAGFEVDTHGLVFGGDAALSEQARVGLAFAYANSQVDGDSRVAPNSADMDLYQLIGYGSYDFDAATQLSWQLDYGQGRTDGKREILFMGSTAKSSYDSHIVHAGVALSHRYSLGQATELVPMLRADYTWIKDESYTEKGADALNLDVDSRTTDSLILGLEGELRHAFDERLLGLLKLGVGYDVIGEQATITSAYSGEPGLSFVTKGLDPSPWLGRVGLGLEYHVSDTVELRANYDAAVREDFLSHTASLTARWAF